MKGDRRAGTLTALGSVTAVAVVVAAGLVGWIRFTAPSAAEPASAALVEEVPESFDGGFAPAPVPEAVAEAVDGPVVGVVVLDEVPGGADVDVCGFGGAGGNRELLWALVTPDGLHVAYVSDEPSWMHEPMELVERGVAGEARPAPDAPAPATPLPPPPDPTVPADPGGAGERYFESCTARWEDGRWIGMGGMGMTVPADRPITPDMGGGISCCDRQGYTTASASMAPAEGAAWLLQDRGGYWLAYPAEGIDLVPLSWRFRENRLMGMRTPSTHVLSVDADGVIIDDRYVSG